MSILDLPDIEAHQGTLHLGVDHSDDGYLLLAAIDGESGTVVALHPTDVYILIAHLASSLRLLAMSPADAKGVHAAAVETMDRAERRKFD